ncbi:NKG2-D type II integral membrane protein-like [Prionailurus viverrinus]|uniref:NKG2-D type II integral membrane protein-like n=1 Tax=Prionailurus viverrinus TaxID=61388 RepID=UPI001FF1C061|nr:NKG2-D type II integral membrane protein-like [Prionailurus viverrinus]
MDERCSMDERRELPRRKVALTLGVTCIFLLLASTGLRYLLFHRYSGATRQDMKKTEEKNASLAEVGDHSIHCNQFSTDNDTFQGKWYCCRKSCYHFSKEEETWERSKVACQDLQSSLVKIDTKEEQIFIQSKITYNYWIGLKVGPKNPRKWLDGSIVSQSLNLEHRGPTVKCACLKPSIIFTTNCSRLYHYICEKEFSGPDN